MKINVSNTNLYAMASASPFSDARGSITKALLNEMAANGINYTSTRGADASHGGITIETTADSPKGSNAHDDDTDLSPYGGERNDISNEPSTFAKHLIDMAEKGGENPHASIQDQELGCFTADTVQFVSNSTDPRKAMEYIELGMEAMGPSLDIDQGFPRVRLIKLLDQTLEFGGLLDDAMTVLCQFRNNGTSEDGGPVIAIKKEEIIHRWNDLKIAFQAALKNIKDPAIVIIIHEFADFIQWAYFSATGTHDPILTSSKDIRKNMYNVNPLPGHEKIKAAQFVYDVACFINPKFVTCRKMIRKGILEDDVDLEARGWAELQNLRKELPYAVGKSDPFARGVACREESDLQLSYKDRLEWENNNLELQGDRANPQKYLENNRVAVFSNGTGTTASYRWPLERKLCAYGAKEIIEEEMEEESSSNNGSSTKENKKKESIPSDCSSEATTESKKNDDADNDGSSGSAEIKMNENIQLFGLNLDSTDSEEDTEEEEEEEEVDEDEELGYIQRDGGSTPPVTTSSPYCATPRTSSHSPPTPVFTPHPSTPEPDEVSPCTTPTSSPGSPSFDITETPPSSPVAKMHLQYRREEPPSIGDFATYSTSIKKHDDRSVIKTRNPSTQDYERSIVCPFHLADPALTVSLPLVKDMVDDIVHAMKQPPTTDGILIPPVIAAHRLVKMTSGAKLKNCMTKKEAMSTLKVLHYYQYIITEGTRHIESRRCLL